MWILEDAVNNITNKVTVPTDGTITVSKPDSVSVNAFVNDATTPIQQVDVKAGDTVYFKLTNWKKGETPIGLNYGDVKDVIMLPGREPKNKVVAVDGAPLAIIETTADSGTTTKEEDIMTPQDTINLFSNPMGGAGTGGAMGAGLGAGLVGGLLGTALFGRRGLGGLDGGDGAGMVGGALTAQSLADMSLMQAIGAVDKAVAVSTATMEASQATQTLGITSQLSSIASALTNNLNQVNTNVMATANETQKTVMQGQAAINQNIMENRYELSRDISADGEKTRALITQQYEINLQRQLADANAAIIELRGDNRLNERTRGIEVTTTNNINQMQQQTQQQQQYGQLANMIYGLSQSIRDTNSAINVGSGTQTSTNTPTNTNIR